MNKPKEIYYKKKLVAIFFPHNLKVEKLKFFTEDKNPFQVGLHNREKGEILPAHIHKVPRIIKIKNIQEFLYIQKGKIELTLFNKKGEVFEKIILEKDDSILLIAEGHGIKILANARIFELKQGPYFGAEHAKVYYKL